MSEAGQVLIGVILTACAVVAVAGLLWACWGAERHLRPPPTYCAELEILRGFYKGQRVRVLEQRCAGDGPVRYRVLLLGQPERPEAWVSEWELR